MITNAKRWVVLVIVATLLYYFVSPKTRYYVYKEGTQIVKVHGKVVPLSENHKKYQYLDWQDKFQESFGVKSEEPLLPRVVFDIYYDQGLTIEDLYDMEELERFTFPDSLSNTFVDDIKIQYTTSYAETQSVDTKWFYNLRALINWL